MAIAKRLLISLSGGVVASGIFCAIHAPETVPFSLLIGLIALPSLAILLLAEYCFRRRLFLCLLIYLATTVPFTSWMLYVWLISGLEGGPMAQFALQNYIIVIVAMYASLQLLTKRTS